MKRRLVLGDIEALAIQVLGEVALKQGSKALLDEAERFSSLALLDRPLRGYKWLCQDALSCADQVRVNAGLDALRVLLRMALLKACLRLVRQDWYANLPERIFMNHNAALVRIAGTSSCDSEWLDPRKDLFHKELGIATFRLIMVGTRVTDPNCGIPRGIIFKGGVGGFLKGVGRFSRLGGFSPYLQNHIHDLTMSRINEGGRIQLWLGCAEVLRLYPALKGLVGSSWLEDPALEFVAPRLYRDNRILRENGSLYFPNGTDEETVRNALAKSTTRQAMYAEGRYNPKRYMVVWPRFELIRWADQWIRDHPEHPGVYAPGA